ncbi:MAG: hypothetical protein [Caudoviricetes sp.]|nr:MAG: hypothetical protein [Caudoviricetes sp.]
MSLKNKSTSLKDWHNAGMSSSWGSVLFGNKPKNNNNNKANTCPPTQKSKSTQ